MDNHVLGPALRPSPHNQPHSQLAMCSQFKLSSIYHRLSKLPQGSDLGMSQLTDLEAILSSHLNLNSPAQRKKLRIVCVSDTHNSSPLNGQFKVPPGDVLIHAGDMTNQGSHSELQKAVEWIGKCEHEVKIVIAGTCDHEPMREIAILIF